MMDKKPLIQQGWVRALLFVASFLAIILLFVFLAERFYAPGIITSDSQGSQDIMGSRFLLLYVLLPVITSFIMVYVFRKLVDRESLTSLGLRLNDHRQAATGFFVALALLGAGTSILVVNKNLRWTDISFDMVQLFLGLGLMAFIAVSEELVFRGYILNNLMQSLNRWWALLISAALFALFHQGNPGITPLAIFNVFAAGLLLGVNYIFTKNLWFGILLHFGWNYYQGPILGYKVSGLTIHSLLRHDITGNQLLTGGKFGFEGSILNGVLTLLAAGLLAWIYENQYKSNSGHAVDKAATA